MPLPFFYCTVLTKPHMGVVVMVGTPCGVWAMGAMWLSQIMLVSGNDHPKLASGQKGKTWSPMGVCYGLWVGCQIHCNNVVISCNWAVAPTANRQVLNGGGCYASKAPDNECGQLQCIGEKRTRLNSQVVGSQSGDVHRANGATNNIDTHAKKPKCMNCCGAVPEGNPMGVGC